MTQDMERCPAKYATLLSNVTQQYGGREKIFFSFQLTLILLTTTIVAPPSNANKWQMGFNP
jgi:hypothetical protein